MVIYEQEERSTVRLQRFVLKMGETEKPTERAALPVGPQPGVSYPVKETYLCSLRQNVNTCETFIHRNRRCIYMANCLSRVKLSFVDFCLRGSCSWCSCCGFLYGINASFSFCLLRASNPLLVRRRTQNREKNLNHFLFDLWPYLNYVFLLQFWADS